MSSLLLKRRTCSLLAMLAVATLAPQTGGAWEGATTHAGLTEQAALGSSLHQRLRDHFGIERGLFAALTVPPADAPELFKVLRTLNPTHGYVPDSRGRLLALGWLAAGSVIADIPAAHAGHHFFDPTSKSGLTDTTIAGLSKSGRIALGKRLAGDAIVRTGMPAVEWITHPDNPMNLNGFLDQYEKAVRSATPAERSRHIAGALIAAGAMMHVLQDMGSPSHVRNDLAAHLDVVGNDNIDVGSRFERIAALAYGRLGVPQAKRTITAPTLQALFSTEKHEGLADHTSQQWFSAYTLPRSFKLRPKAGASAMAKPLQQSLVRPYPAPLPQLDLDAARSEAGGRLLDDRGVCVANYLARDHRLSWYLDDTCMAEQIAVILPEVSAYSAGMLDHLFRGTLVLARDNNTDNKAMAIKVGEAPLGAGTLQLFWDDARGVRQALGGPHAIERADVGEVIASLNQLPKGAHALAALYRGVDQNQQPLVAAGHVSLVVKPQPKAP